MDQFIKRSCPICHAPEGARKAMSSAPPAETLDFGVLKNSWHGFFKEKHFFSYLRCQCGLLYCREFFNQSQLEMLYGSMPDNTAGVPSGMLEKTQRGYFEVLQKHLKSGGSYLEIGPDIGLFARLAAETGKFDRHWLFEPNKAVHAVLGQAMQGRKYDICTDLFDYSRIPDGTVSCLVMIHVLDHVLEPKAMLEALRHKLTSDAVVLFVTHDESSLLTKLLRAKWPAFCLQHPQLFRPATIGGLLHHAGYELVEVKKSYNYFPVMYLLKHALWTVGIQFPEFKKLNWLKLPLKLGNIISVGAPRKSA